MKSTPSDFSSDWSLQSVPQCIFNDTLFEVFDDKNTLIGALQNATLTIEQANYVFDESKKYYNIGDCFDIIRSCDVDLGNKPDLVCMLLNTLCDTLQFDLFKKIGHIIQDLENMLISCHPKLSRKNSLNLASIIDKSRQNAENTEYSRNSSKLNKQNSNLQKLGSRTEIDEKNAFVLMEDEGSMKVERVNPPKSNSSVKTTVQKGSSTNSANISKLNEIEIKNGYRTFYDVYEILQNAYKENDENAINYAIDNNYTNILNDAEENMLHQIARRGDTDFLKYMHKKGMDITQRSHYGYTVLHCFCEANIGTPIDGIKYTMKYIDINDSLNTLKNTPLHIASEESNIETVEFLLSLPNVKKEELNEERKTPADLADDEECQEVFENAGFDSRYW